MITSTYLPRFTPNSEGDFYRLYAVTNFTLSTGSYKKIKYAVRNITTNKSYKIRKNLWNKKDNCCYTNRGTVEEQKECRLANLMMRSIEKAVLDITDECMLKKMPISVDMLTEKKVYERIYKNEDYQIPASQSVVYLEDYWLDFIEKAKVPIAQ